MVELEYKDKQTLKDLVTVLECLDKNVRTELEKIPQFPGMLEAAIYRDLANALDLVKELKQNLLYEGHEGIL